MASPREQIPAHQEELALSCVLSHARFPGRTTLYVAEVAAALSITEQHVLDLIEEGLIHAINIAGRTDAKGGMFGGARAVRKFWRIPVTAYDEFVRSRHNLSDSGSRAGAPRLPATAPARPATPRP